MLCVRLGDFQTDLRLSLDKHDMRLSVFLNYDFVCTGPCRVIVVWV